MKQRHFGFTIIELMVVVGLMAILLTLALSELSTSRVKSRDNVRVTDIQKIRMAIEQYRTTCGVYPATLDVATNNGRSGTCSAQLGDFIGVIPSVPSYSGNQNPQQGSTYLYTGLSTQPNGPCYDYHIAVQLEYGADNNYADGKSSEFFDNDHDYNPTALGVLYGSRCAGTNPVFITGAHDDQASGLYDFRGSLSEAQ